MLRIFFKNFLFFFCLLSLGHAASKGESSSTNYIALQGFDVAHAAGYEGQRQTIAVLNDAPDPTHPAFQVPFSEGRIKIFDVTRSPQPTHRKNENIQDISTFRYPISLTQQAKMIINDMDDSSFSHGNHVVGLIIGEPGRYGDVEFLGGAAPKCRVNSYIITPLNTLSLEGAGSAFLSYYQKVNIEGEERMSPFMFKRAKAVSAEYPELLKERPLDDAILQAFHEISQTPAVAINASFVMTQLYHPKTYQIPTELLDRIGDCLEKGDQILVVSANNDYGFDLSSETASSQINSLYLQQFVAHPKIGPRLLIAVNAQPNQIQGQDPRKARHSAILASKERIALFYSSNIPGGLYKPIKGTKTPTKDKIWAFAVSAYGSYNLSPYQRDGFSIESGTSEAAPQVASLCALIKQKYPHLTASQIVERVKMSTTPVLPEMRPIYGRGVINAARALELGRFEKSPPEIAPKPKRK